MPRCFIAITPPGDVLGSAGEIQMMMRGALSARHSIRWTPAEQFHVTLRFLGDIQHDQVSEVKNALNSACSTVSPFRLQLADPGAFPSLRRPRALWVGVRGEVDQLKRLQASISEHCSRFGQSAKQERFHPHLTLARIRDPCSVADRALEALLGELKTPGSNAWKVGSVELIESILTPDGAVYETIAQVQLPEHPADTG